MKLWMRILAPLIVIAAGALAAWGLYGSRDEPEMRDADVPLPVVRVQYTRLQSLRLNVTSQGTVSPRTESVLVPEVSGTVTDVAASFIPGGFFEEGDLLLRIDPHDYRQAVIQAQAAVAAADLRLALEQAEADVVRREWDDLGRGDASPLTLREPQLANARAMLASARAAAEKARRDLERTELRAPYAGRVREKRVDRGQFVNRGTPLGTIYAVDYAEIRLPLPDSELAFLDLPLIYRGDEAQGGGPEVVLSSDFAGRIHRWRGRIVRTEGEIDPQSRMVHTVARVKDPYARGDVPGQPPLAAGMFVDAEILGREVDGVAVLPRSALRDGNQVLVIDDEDRLRFRTVGVLRVSREEIIVESGLAEGERVCLTSIVAVTDGMRVRTIDATPEQDPAGVSWMGSIGWFVRNPVAANLLMLMLLAGGAITVFVVKQEVFPEFSLDMISVSVEYRGAAPAEVEEGVCVRIEEAIQGLDGVKRITSTASESQGVVIVELMLGADARKVLDDVKSRVDAIDTFPVETEKPVIREITNRRQVVDVAVWGDASELALRHLGEQVRDQLSALPEITLVELTNARPFEVSIEVSERALRRYGLTFDQVAAAVRRSSLDLPGGSVKTGSGEILLRTKGQAYRAPAFEDLVLISRFDGTHLRLGDVATVVDGFAETDQLSRFDGKPAFVVSVFRVGQQDALGIANAVYGYIETAQRRLPEGVTLTSWNDAARLLQSRRDLLLRNGMGGLLLVFGTLALFLRFRLAFWVVAGMLISFMGAIWLMPVLDVSINMISLFAFILVLGIVVDDAIVAGENIYTHQHRHGDGRRGAIEGAREVSVPVTFAVLTTVAAFSPLVMVAGSMGKIMRVIPLIVIPCLLWSLVESLWILPAHLSHYRHKPQSAAGERGLSGAWRRFQYRFAQWVQRFIHGFYSPLLEVALRQRYMTLAVGVATLLLTVGLVTGGYVGWVFFPDVESDFISAALTLPPGTPAEVTADAVRQLEQGAEGVRRELLEEHGVDHFSHVLSAIGEQPFARSQSQNAGGFAGRELASHLGEVTIELLPGERRIVGAGEISARWREMTGTIPDAIALEFTSSLFSPGDDINVQLTGPDIDELRDVADQLKRGLATFNGVQEITDSFRPGKQELKLSIKPGAEALGLTLADLGRQVRQAFYGEEAQRIQRGRDDLRVMVRYPESDRRSLGTLESMRVRTPDGREVPFSEVARVEPGRGYSSIKRVDRRRAINVTADIDPTEAAPEEVIAAVRSNLLPALLHDHPDVTYSLEGQQAEQRDTMTGLARGFAFALLAIFGLLAVPLRSYVQPLVIMAAIPFGLVGAVWGHVIMGLDLTILSLFGLVALAGVVVNDSLVMVDFINRHRAAGGDLAEAVRQAGVARFRPILLTSLTTFAGLFPLLIERSMQARFLIPMAVSLAFGVVFATFITLVLIPSAYLVMEDVRGLLGVRPADSAHAVPAGEASTGFPVRNP